MAHISKKVLGDMVEKKILWHHLWMAPFNNESRGGGVLSHVQRDNFIDVLNQNTKIMNYKTQNVRKF